MSKAQQSGTQRKAPIPPLYAQSGGAAVADEPHHTAQDTAQSAETVRDTRARAPELVLRGIPATAPDQLSEDPYDALVELVSSGYSVVQACEVVGLHQMQVWRKRKADAAFGERLLEAREVCAHMWAEETIAIADSEEDPNKARVRIDARKWAASKMVPRVYGEKAVVEHSGPDGAAIAHRVEVALVPATAGVVVDVPARLAQGGGDHDGDKAA